MEYHLEAKERTFTGGVPDLVSIEGGDRIGGVLGRKVKP